MIRIKILGLSFIALATMMSCGFGKDNDKKVPHKTMLSKVKYKTKNTESDTLWVLQNDTVYFKYEELINTRPCSYPELVEFYTLIAPIDGAYYYIYNSEEQLIEEGKYTKEYTYEGATSEEGGFFNVKSYYYKSNGRLSAIHYMEDGRNGKTETYNRKGQLSEILYFEKKSSDRSKVEYYNSKGQLEKTKVYTGFSEYYTVKAKVD